MPKALKPEKCLKKFFDSKIKANQDRWNAGLENKYFEWQDFRDKVEVALEQSERNSGMLYALNQENAKLKYRNEVLERENERLKQVEKDYQALLKAQEQEDDSKAFKLIIYKNVDVKEIRPNATAKSYNSKIPYYRQYLTENEFRFLKEMVHRFDCSDIVYEEM